MNYEQLDKQRKWGAKLFSFILFIVLIIGATFAAFDVWSMVTVTSNSYGTPNYYSQKEVDVLIDSYYYTLTFIPNSDETYSYIDEFEELQFDGSSSDYKLTLNNYSQIATLQSAGYIDSDFTIYFYNIDGDLTTSILINVRLEFYTTKTLLKITVNNNNDALTYLNTYVAKEGFEIKLMEEI